MPDALDAIRTPWTRSVPGYAGAFFGVDAALPFDDGVEAGEGVAGVDDGADSLAGVPDDEASVAVSPEVDPESEPEVSDEPVEDPSAPEPFDAPERLSVL
jgi:hypothetical protein